jgi:hypothetical protein
MRRPAGMRLPINLDVESDILDAEITAASEIRSQGRHHHLIALLKKMPCIIDVSGISWFAG